MMDAKIKYFLAAILLFLFALFLVVRHPIPFVRIGNVIIPVEIAKDDAAREKGLSGRTSLDRNSGMLFIFQRPDIYSFWMPDMHFPIDIVWINNGKVIGITANVSSEFDPAHPRFYTPPEPAHYVLEVNSGFAKTRNIAVGNSVNLNQIE